MAALSSASRAYPAAWSGLEALTRAAQLTAAWLISPLVRVIQLQQLGEVTGRPPSHGEKQARCRDAGFDPFRIDGCAQEVRRVEDGTEDGEPLPVLIGGAKIDEDRIGAMAVQYVGCPLLPVAEQ